MNVPDPAEATGGDPDLGVPPAWWARLGHDLRGPLGPMRMAVQVLRSGRGSADEQKEALALLDRQIDRMLAEIDDTADLVRARNGLALVRRRPGDLNLLLDPISGRVSLLRSLAERGQVLACVPADRDLQADHDPSRLCTILEFLVRKAAAHAGAGATLQLALHDAGDGHAAFHLGGFDARLFDDADLAWLLGRGGEGVEQLGLRPVLVRELVRQSGAGLAANGEVGTLVLALPLASG